MLPLDKNSHLLKVYLVNIGVLHGCLLGSVMIHVFLFVVQANLQLGLVLSSLHPSILLSSQPFKDITDVCQRRLRITNIILIVINNIKVILEGKDKRFLKENFLLLSFQLLNLLDDTLFTNTIVPLVIKCCENARNIYFHHFNTLALDKCLLKLQIQK